MKDIKNFISENLKEKQLTEAITVDIDDIDISEFTWEYDDYSARKDDIDCLNASEDELDDLINSSDSGTYTFEFSIDEFGTLAGTIKVKCTPYSTKYSFDLRDSDIESGNVKFWADAMNQVMANVIGYDLDSCDAYDDFCRELKSYI